MAVMKDGQPLLGTNASPGTTETAALTILDIAHDHGRQSNKSTHARNEAIMQFYSTIGATPTHIEPIHGDTKRIGHFKCLINPRPAKQHPQIIKLIAPLFPTPMLWPDRANSMHNSG